MSLPNEEKAIAKGLIAELEASDDLGCSRESGHRLVDILVSAVCAPIAVTQTVSKTSG